MGVVTKGWGLVRAEEKDDDEEVEESADSDSASKQSDAEPDTFAHYLLERPILLLLLDREDVVREAKGHHTPHFRCSSPHHYICLATGRGCGS